MTPDEQTTEIDATVIVPCFNEEAVVGRLIEELLPVLESTGRTFEVVFVDDGSSDRTLELLRDSCSTDPRLRYVSLSRNFGKEAGMLAGLRYARGAAVVFIDADLQHPPELIPQLLDLIDAGHDQVIARRDRHGDPAMRTAISRLYYRFVNAMIDVRIQDGSGDFRALSRPAVEAVLSMRETNRYSKGLFAWIGFDTTTISYRNAQRADGESKWSGRALFNYALDSVISFNNKPLRLAIYLGVLLSLVAVGYAAWVLGGAIFYGNAVPGYTTLVCAVVGLGGLQIILLGVIGEYLGRIYMETKSRPHFLVQEIDGQRAGRRPTGLSGSPDREA